MKNIVLIVVITLLVPLVLMLEPTNLLKNGDFERFSAGEPTGWTTNNIPTMLSVVSPSSKSYSGKLSVKCEVKDFHGTKMAGMISQKERVHTFCLMRSTLPLSAKKRTNRCSNFELDVH